MEDKNELDILNWFEKQHAWKRLELFSKLLGKAHPVELHFLHTFVEDLITPHLDNMRGTIEFCNRPDALKTKLKRKLNSRSNYESTLDQELILSMALMQSRKYKVADTLYEYVAKWLDDKLQPSLFENKDINDWLTHMDSFTDGEINQCLMLTTMLMIHPTFSVRQKEDIYYRFLLLKRFHAKKICKDVEDTLNYTMTTPPTTAATVLTAMSPMPIPPKNNQNQKIFDTQKTVFINQPDKTVHDLFPKLKEEHKSFSEHGETSELIILSGMNEDEEQQNTFYHQPKQNKPILTTSNHNLVQTNSERMSRMLMEDGQKVREMQEGQRTHTSLVMRQIPKYNEPKSVQSHLHHQVKARYSNEARGNYDGNGQP